MLYNLLSFRAQPYLFALFFSLFYLIIPMVIFCQFDANPYFFQLIKISFISLLAMAIGFILLPKALNLKRLNLITLNGKIFVCIVFFMFLLFMIVVLVTADSIPLFLAFKKHDPYQISISRANFLKARHGYEAIFVYINSLLTSSFVPYALVLCFVKNYRLKFIGLLVPYLYSFVFIEKVFFLKFILPFSSYCASCYKIKKYKYYLYAALISIPMVIYVNTVLSGFGSLSVDSNLSFFSAEENKSISVEVKRKLSLEACESFYSPKYISCANKGRVDFIIWRIFAVPIFTARDSLRLFDTQYQSKLLMGRTSSAVSLLTRQKNIKFEREVFNLQWGGEETGTASANSVFIIEQFVNFGWLGVIISSILVGYIFNLLSRSKDTALSSLTIIFSLSLFCGGFISTMLSGGYLFLFAFLYIVHLEFREIRSHENTFNNAVLLA